MDEVNQNYQSSMVEAELEKQELTYNDLLDRDTETKNDNQIVLGNKQSGQCLLSTISVLWQHFERLLQMLKRVYEIARTGDYEVENVANI